MRDIGTAGESFIEQWCALSGITANRSHKDFFGWDLHFEMPHLNDIAKADGLHQADIECKVQVKTTDTDKMTEAVELSNLRAMATCTLPAFYILVKLEGGSQVVSAHLLHIDDALCEKILARIRKETSKNGKVKLNKKFMTLDFKTGVQIIPPGGEGLKKEIMEHIGASQADYVIKKQKFLQSVGYELHSHEISVQIAMENADRFVRMLLGDKDKIEVKSIDASVTRFGVTETLEGLRSDTAIISLGNIVPDGRAKVIFRNRKSGAASEFDLDVYRGGSAACIPPKHRIVRLRSTLFTMDISPFHNNLKMYFHGDNDVTYDVVEVLKNYTLLQMLSNPREIDISIKINESHLNGKLSGDGFAKDFDRSVELLEAVIFIKNFYNYYNYLGVSAGWFDRYSTSILNYRDIISGHANLDRIEFVFTVDDSLDDDSEVDFLVALPIVIDQKCFVSLIVFHGRSKMIEDGSYATRPENIKVIYKTFFNIESLTSGSAMKDLEEAANAYDSSCIKISFLNKYMDAVVTNAKNATPIER